MQESDTMGNQRLLFCGFVEAENVMDMLAGWKNNGQHS